MRKNTVLLFLCPLLLLLVACRVSFNVPVSAAPASIRVPQDYQTVQEAINHAGEGDIILVSSGTYYENVIVNKTISLVGENSHSTIIDGGGVENVIHVRANNVSIHGLTVRNSGSEYPFAGIFLEDVIDSNVSFCNVTNNHYGILLIYSSRNSLSRNTVAMNYMGVKLWASWYNNTLSQNIMTRNYHSGVGLSTQSDYNTLVNNTISHSWYGIWMIRTWDNVIAHNNFINTSIPAYSLTSRNTWDNGYPSGGNFWNDHNSFDLYSGLHQNETGDDGIGDTPYVIDTKNIDRYPLVHPIIRPTPDLNNDGKVDIRDVSMVSLAFGAYPGHPRWDPFADITGPILLERDGQVDLRDISIVASCFGKTETP